MPRTGRKQGEKLAGIQPPGSGMSHEQRELLLVAMRLYLNYLWTKVAPSPDRNSTIRVLQTLKGKLLDHLEQPSRTSSPPLWLSADEQVIVKDMLNEVIRNAGNLPELSGPAQQAGLRDLREQVEWNGSI